MGQTTDALLEQRDIEVDKQFDAAVRELEIGNTRSLLRAPACCSQSFKTETESESESKITGYQLPVTRSPVSDPPRDRPLRARDLSAVCWWSTAITNKKKMKKSAPYRINGRA